MSSPASFVGRKLLLARLAPLVVGEARARVVTLTGMGGIGKTSLALEVANANKTRFLALGGVWMCDATEARTLEDVVSVVASALDVKASGGTAAQIAQIARAIAGLGPTLILIDNFEQVVEHAPATIERWSAMAAEATFLVTSRERLRVPGEVAFELEPLSEAEAVELLVDRARRVRGGYEPAEGDAEYMLEVVRRVEGIPLAIELCAARMGVLGARQLAALLATHAELVLERKPSGNKRVTLRQAIEWSWALLDPELRLALARCSVFHGGWSLEAAMAVVSPDLDTMQALHDKSLMRASEDASRPGERRYHLYESVRELAAEKLALFGETESAMQKHAAFYLDIGDEWSRGVDGPGGLELRARLALEIDNLLAIATHALAEMDDPERTKGPALEAASRRAIDALLVLVPLLSQPRLSYAAVARLLERAVAGLSDKAENRSRAARARIALARSCLLEGRFADSIPEFERAIASARLAGDRKLEALGLVQLGGMLERFGKKSEAEAYTAEARALAAELADPSVDAFLHGYTAEVHGREGRAQEAAEHYQISLDCFRAQGDVVREAMALGSIGRAWLDLGHLEDAESASQQAAEIASRAGDRRNEGFCLSTIGRVHQARGAWDDARAAFEGAVALHVALGDAWGEACDWGLVGGLSLEEGRYESALEAFDRASRMLDEIGDRTFAALARAGLAAAEASLGRTAQADAHRKAAQAAV
ncbi:MAG: protein kinase/LuxR family transcriptional regulator, partial [Myxococcaceae bacterium]|nr:protein kinase/LuxR family transcriptional regulator [Myxococcaceae bacterium]